MAVVWLPGGNFMAPERRRKRVRERQIEAYGFHVTLKSYLDQVLEEARFKFRTAAKNRSLKEIC